MSGTINLALTQQFDMDGRPLSGGLLYFYVAATTTPQSAFQDTGLTIPWPNPLELDASGRVPMFYLADGNIKIRLTDQNGVVIIAADSLLVIGPSAGGGGGGTVDPTSLTQTGDIKARFGVGQLTGYVRCNGLSIGNATSGATERANADTQPLFEYLWATNVLAVTPTRGASATADYNANKQIVTPDLRGRSIAGMDDMGAAAAGRLTASFFGAAATTLGNAGGSEQRTLTAAQLAPHTHSVNGSTQGFSNDHSHTFGGTTSNAGTHAHTISGSPTLTTIVSGPGGTNITGGATANGFATFGIDGAGDHTHTFSGTTSGVNANHTHGISFTSGAGDGVAGSAHAIASPAMVITFYIKL